MNQSEKSIVGSYSYEVKKYYCIEHMLPNEKTIESGSLEFYWNNRAHDNYECGLCNRTLLPPF